MSRSSTDGPLVTTVVPAGNFSSAAASCTTCEAAPSSSSDALPGNRVTICAVRSSTNTEFSDFRTVPSLLKRRNFTHSGLVKVRWSCGMAVNRSSVAIESLARAVAAAEPGASFACAAISAFPATLSVGLPVGLCTSASEYSSAVSGDTTASTWPLS